MQVIKIEVKREASNDNRWSASPNVQVAYGYPQQPARFTRDAVAGAIIGFLIVALLWSLT